MSPTLFNFYLSDLPKFLNTTSSTDIMLGDRSINCLLYPDDLVIFSRSAKNLQIILNKLESFCENADLRVNLEKTKIMIFNNCGKSTTFSDTALLNWKRSNLINTLDS